MDFTHVLRLIFLALHFISVAAVLGGWFANFKRPTVTTSQWWGSIGMLISGLVLATIVSIVGDPNHMKLGIKALLGVIVFVAALIGRRKINSGESVGKGIAHAVGGMALINVLVAVFI